MSTINIDAWTFESGDGTLSLDESDTDNRLEFGVGISLSDLTFSRANADGDPGKNDLRIDLGGGDSVVFDDFFSAALNHAVRLNAFGVLEFDDGSTFDLRADPLMLSGAAADDVLQGTSGADVLLGLAGDDVIEAGDGEDSLEGGSGDDALNGGAGMNVLIGGLGDDVITVNGSDRVVYNSGDGADQIARLGSDSDNRLEFGVGISLSDLTFSRTNADGDPGKNDLRIDLGGGDSVVFDDFFSAAANDAVRNNPFGVLAFDDGSTFDLRAEPLMLSGTPGDDVLQGTSGADVLLGLAGDDVIEAGDGEDSLEGGSGDDALNGGAGMNVLIGGLGDDVITVNGSDRVVYNSGDGADQIARLGSDSDNRLEFGVGISLSDLTFSRTNADGDPGKNDLRIDLGGGDSVVFDDFFSAAANDAVRNNPFGVLAFDDGSTFDLRAEPLMLSGTPGDDVLQGTSGADVLLGLAGDDVIEAGDGDDTARGGQGVDRISGNQGDDRLEGGAGDDDLYGGGGDDVLIGGAGADELFGRPGADTASYEGSNAGVAVNLAAGTASGGHATGDVLDSIENLTGSGHVDVLTGDSAANVIDGGVASDVLRGRGGDDTVIGGRGFDSMSGNQGDDVLDGGRGDDDLFGGGGDDVLIGGVGADELFGRPGADTASYAGSNAGVAVNLAAGTASGGHATGDVLDSIENLTGSDFVDVLTGDAGANVIEGGVASDVLRGRGGDDDLAGGRGFDTITGNQGDDVLDGGGGNDDLHGGGGDDVITGGAGADELFGRPGADTASYEGSNAGVAVNLAAETASGGHAAGDVLTSIENLTGSDHVDRLFGDAGANVIDGGVASDVLRGGGGDDTVIGGRGFDTITGNQGDDVLDGGGGDDDLFGGGGDDVITGGDGDEFIYGRPGADIAVFSGDQSDYAITVNMNGTVTVSDQRAGGPDGTDTLDSVETLRFADGDIATPTSAEDLTFALAEPGEPAPVEPAAVDMDPSDLGLMLASTDYGLTRMDADYLV